MKWHQRPLPSRHFETKPKIDTQVSALPFLVKEIGFASDRKVTFGSSNQYSEYLFFYSYGSMSFMKHGSRYSVMQDDVVVSACNTPLRFAQAQKNDYIYVVIGGTSAQLYYNHIRNKTGVFHTSPLTPVAELFVSLLYLDYKKQPVEAQLEASVILHQLLHEMYQISKNILYAKSITPVQDTAVNTAIRYIQENYAQPLDVDTICDSVSFSKYYFCKLFKEYTGMTIHQYLVEYRINRSKELLSYSQLSIAGVASSVGFKSALTFSRQFKELVHMTPTRYRELY